MYDIILLTCDIIKTYLKFNFESSFIENLVPKTIKFYNSKMYTYTYNLTIVIHSWHSAHIIKYITFSILFIIIYNLF